MVNNNNFNNADVENASAKYINSGKKKVAILGTAPSVKDAPFNDPEFDIWGVAHCTFLPQVTRMDVVFEIHLDEIWKNDHAPFERFPNSIIYFLNEQKDIPNARRYPREEIFSKYKINKGTPKEYDYVSSSIPYMVMMAIEEGYEEIHVYGIHLLQEDEYFYQRPCLEYYLGIAAGKGIKLYIPPDADILKFGMVYGVQDGTHEVTNIEARHTEFQSRINAITMNKDRMFSSSIAELSRLEGMKIVLSNLITKKKKKNKLELDAIEKIKEIDRKTNEIIMKRDQLLRQAEGEINQLIGAAEDCKYWARRLGKELRK